MPRLEIESVADFKVLYEIGALTPDMSLKLSRVLVGDNVLMSKRQKTGNGKPMDKEKPDVNQNSEDEDDKTKRKRSEESGNLENKKKDTKGVKT